MIEKNRATFQLEKFTKDTNFSNFESHYETAVLLYHYNSGHAKFSGIYNLICSDASGSVDSVVCAELEAEILEETSTPKEEESLLNEYLSKMGC